MWIGGRRRAIHRIAAGAGAHEHHTHAVGVTAVDGLQIAVVEGVLPQHRDQALDDFLIRDRPMLLDALCGIFVTLAAKAYDDVRKGFAEKLVLGLAALFERLEFCWPILLKLLR